jgi:hypothetical protein
MINDTEKKLNIYPKNDTNIQAIIEYNFAELELNTEGVMEYLMNEKSSLELNQIEFICRKVNKGYLNIFRPNLKGQIELKNLLSYAVDALTKNRTEWNGSQNRIRITQEFLDFIKQTEINIDYLEKNN